MKLILLKDIPELKKQVGDIIEFNPKTDRYDAPGSSFYVSDGTNHLISLKVDVDAGVLQYMEESCNCYSTGSCDDGKIYIIRNDCPIHKGSL